MSLDVAIRICAALAAVALVAAPFAAKAFAWAKSHLEAGVQEVATEGVKTSDLHLVLDLASRLKAAGLTEGVSLCQQLLDVMLGKSPKAKR